MTSFAESEPSNRRDKVVLAIEDLPDEFVAALRQRYANDEQSALDRLMDEK